MMELEEMVILQHRLTEQTIMVTVNQYFSEAHRRFRNFKLKGQGQFIAPPDLNDMPLLEQTSRQCESGNYHE